MRSIFICVFITILVRTEGSSENDEDFQPTPIPLNEWRGEMRPAGTLHELIKTEAPPTVAAVPAHYWEDALRHSVYLTLVRDKIDQLIAKGAIISPDSKPDNISKEVDDHDLWEKIKTAQFDRLKEEPIPPADVTILARGRLLEEKDGFRFAEDDASQEKCNDADCTKGVKAFWSVKRVRQNEVAGKYHYELTFAVTSQTPKKMKKPYENPVRTFTVKENAPTVRPPPAQNYEHVHDHQARPQRAIWFHKNIVPTQTYQRRPAAARGLERIFSSLFSDEDSYEEPTYKYKQPNTYVPQPYPQHAKLPYVDREAPYHQKKLLPYPVKPPNVRYSRPPLQAPPVSYVQHPYVDQDPNGNKPHVPPYPDNRHVPPYADNRHVPSNVIKTTRPAVLPTPITNYPLLKESSIDVPIKTKLNATEHTYTTTEAVVTTYKIYNHPKHAPMKVSYFPEHLRPPVYNAPPGVFVTMDKKPFKPMPPLKYVHHSGKPSKNVPVDFRPSPQVHDPQYSDHSDAAADNAFRPININYTDIFGSSEESGRKVHKNNRKPITGKKPLKKHANIKPQHLTTTTPDIITVHTDIYKDDDSMQWANLLGAFTKTTPMASQTEKTTEDNEPMTTTTPIPTTAPEDNDDIAVSATASPVEQNLTTTSTTTTSTTTAFKSKKRTRPPPSFKKLDKVRKHKRVTTTTTTTTTTSTTTAKPTRKFVPKKKPSDDLTPQASSAATSGSNSIWDTKPPIIPITTTSTEPPTTTVIVSTTPSTTTTRQTTTKVPSTVASTPYTQNTFVTSPPRNKNRFRESTLMIKGTSVKHDKWSVPVLEPVKNRTSTVSPSKFPLRRKASKFHGYIPSTTPRQPEAVRNREDHQDRVSNTNKNEEMISTTQQYFEQDIQIKTSQPEQHVEDTSSEWNDDNEDEDENKNASNDEKEYIFPVESTAENHSGNNVEHPSFTEATIIASALTSAKNKTKCKKKKHHNLTSDENTPMASETESTSVPLSSSTTTTESAASDFLSELFAGFTMDDATEKPAPTQVPVALEPSESESEKHEQYAQIGDDLDIEKFLHSLDQKTNHQPETSTSADDDEDYDDEDEDDDDDDDFSPFNNDEDNLDSRHFNNEEYYDESSEAQESRDKPISLLELMAME